MPTMKNRQDMIDEMNKKSRAEKVNSFDQSAKDRAQKQNMYTNANKLPTKEKYGPGEYSGGIDYVDRELKKQGL